ncbi:hypothetical protein GCM10010515_55910 [Streptomyces fructofermentans]|uniref:Uncharacterized protein n=1 Tax=Streptomyces fructofermentans TaxID=152141 RepID=A0A918U294_9ACTN|nr:hypothetical protein GCM10010515_55910 [Streptomyces fructofermentans]
MLAAGLAVDSDAAETAVAPARLPAASPMTAAALANVLVTTGRMVVLMAFSPLQGGMGNWFLHGAADTAPLLRVE